VCSLKVGALGDIDIEHCAECGGRLKKAGAIIGQLLISAALSMQVIEW
jgi:hypothetical protein